MNFVTDENGRQTPTDANNISPRDGFVYQLNARTVVRGGSAFMYAPPPSRRPLMATPDFKAFDAPHRRSTSLDGGRTPLTYLRDPFPDGFCATDGARPDPTYSGLGFPVAYTGGITDSGWGAPSYPSTTLQAGRTSTTAAPNRALSPDDVSSRLVMSFNAEPPFGCWQFNVILTLQAGRPVTLFPSTRLA